MSDQIGAFDLADFDIDQAPKDFVPEIVEPDGNCIDRGEDDNG
jgi:hypothetical protein